MLFMHSNSILSLNCVLRSSTEDCLVLICCGLYDLLRGILLLLPDLMLEEVMDKLIQPEALIVLVNHSSPLIQQGVMKVGSASFRGQISYTAKQLISPNDASRYIVSPNDNCFAH